MKLTEIVNSDAWDDNIKQDFFIKLKRSPSDYHKMQNCIVKAYNIASSKDRYKSSEAIKLIDYALDNYDDKFCKARAMSVKGIILERYFRDYIGAYECYTKWAEMDSNLIGHDFDRLRAWLRASKLRPNEHLIKLVENINKGNLPTKEVRFWIMVATSVLYMHEGAFEDSKRLAKSALEIIGENGPTIFQKMFKRHKELPDDLDVTKGEIQLVWRLASKGKI